MERVNPPRLDQLATLPRVIWRPNKGPQTWLISCPIEDIFYGGGRGGGKSDGLLGKWIAHWKAYGVAAAGIIFRRTLKQLEQLMKRAKALFTPLGAKYGKTEKTWTFPDGATLKLRYLERPEDAEEYHGHEYTFIGCDEAGNYPTSEAIDLMRGSLRSSTPGVVCQLVLTGMPGGVGHEWLKRRYVTPAKPLTPHVDPETGVHRVFIPALLKDNPVLMGADPNYSNRLRGVGSPWLVKAWLEGDWTGAPQGRILKSGLLQLHDRDPMEIAKALRLRVTWYWDFAVTEKQTQKDDPDYTAGLCCARDSLNRFWILDAWRGQVEPEEAARMIVRLQQKWAAFGAQVKGERGVIEKCLAPIMRFIGRESGKFVYIHPLGKGAVDKVAHSVAYQNLLSCRQVNVPRGASWLRDLSHEHDTFPIEAEGIHDDWIDCLSYAANDETPAGDDSGDPVRAGGFHPSQPGSQILTPSKAADEDGDWGSWDLAAINAAYLRCA